MGLLSFSAREFPPELAHSDKIQQGVTMKQQKLTTKQKRDRRLKIKRRRLRRQKYGM